MEVPIVHQGTVVEITSKIIDNKVLLTHKPIHKLVLVVMEIVVVHILKIVALKVVQDVAEAEGATGVVVVLEFIHQLVNMVVREDMVVIKAVQVVVVDAVVHLARFTQVVEVAASKAKSNQEVAAAGPKVNGSPIIAKNNSTMAFTKAKVPTKEVTPEDTREGEVLMLEQVLVRVLIPEVEVMGKETVVMGNKRNRINILASISAILTIIYYS